MTIGQTIGVHRQTDRRNVLKPLGSRPYLLKNTV